MGSLDVGSPVPALAPAVLPDKRAGNLADLKFPPLDLRGWEADLAKLSPEDRAKFVSVLEDRVNALRTIRDLRTLGEEKMREANEANAASIRRRDEQLAELFRANPTLKALFERMEHTLERQIATELPRREQHGTAAGTAELIRSCLEKMPPDTATVFEILRSADQAFLKDIRESFRSTMQGAEPVERQIEMYLDGIKGLKDQDRELLLRLFGGKIDDFEGTALVAAMQSKAPSTDPSVMAEFRMILRGEISLQLGDNAGDIDRRIASFNRLTSRRDLFERWLEQELKDPAKLKEFRDWEASFNGGAGGKTVLFDRFIRRGGLTAEQAARFEAYVEANIGKEPNHFAKQIEAQLGTGTKYMEWLDARKTGNTRLAESIMLVEAIQIEKAPSRDILMFMMRLQPEERLALSEAYYEKYGKSNPAYNSDHSKCLFDALTTRRDNTQPDPWSNATRKVLAAYLSGAQVNQQQLEVELAVAALGFREGMKEGEIARVNGVDLNFLLESKKTPEERQAFIRQVEAQIDKYLVGANGGARQFHIDPTRAGAMIESYLSQYSAPKPETVTVLTVKKGYLDEIRRLGNQVNNQGLSEEDRRSAAAQLNSLNQRLEAERLEFKRAEERLRRGEISELPANVAGNLQYFDKNALTTIDSRAQWTQLVRALITEGAQDERRVNQYVLRVEGGDPRSRQLMEYARMLDGDISHSLMNIRGGTSNLLRSWQSYDNDFRVSWGNHICGLFSYASGATEEAERGIRRDEQDVQRRMSIFVDTQERVKNALVGMERDSKAYHVLELKGNLAELLGDYNGAQNHYNQAQLAYKKAEEEILKAHNKSVEERVQANRKLMRELAESNERLAKVDQTLAGYQDAIVKTGVIVGATAVCIATGGAAAPGVVGFMVSVGAGTGAGAAGSVLARSYQYRVQGKGDKIGGAEWRGQVLDDTYDAFFASVGARGASGITQGRTAVATSRAQIVRAHVSGNMFAAGTMFTGNTGKNAAAVYGTPFSEGALAKREKQLGRPLTEEERTKVFEEHRLTAGQLTRDGFTYFATAYVGGKISGHTHALGGSFQQVAPGVTKHVASESALRGWAVGTTNFVGQTGVAVGGNGMNYAYYKMGLEKEFHFDAGLLVAPAGNINLGGGRIQRGARPGSAHEGPVPTGAHPGGGDPHAPSGGPRPTGAHPEPPGPSASARARLHTEAAELTAAGNHVEAAKKHAESAQLGVKDASAALTDAKSGGTRAQVTEAEGNLQRAHRASLDAEQVVIDQKRAANPTADVTADQKSLNTRRAAHAEDVLASHKQAHSEPLGPELVARRQLEVEAAQARLRAHETDFPTATGAESVKRRQLEAAVAKAELESHRVQNPSDRAGLRRLEEAELNARERHLTEAERVLAEKKLTGADVTKEEAALKKQKAEHAADKAAVDLRQHVEDHGASPTGPEAAERSRRVNAELEARGKRIEALEAEKPKGAAKEQLELAKKTLERDLLRAELDGHRPPGKMNREQLQQKLFATEEQVLRIREKQVVEEQRRLDTSRANGEPVDPLKQSRTTERAAQIESERAQLALDRATAALDKHKVAHGENPPPTEVAQRARLEAEVQQRQQIAEHEAKAAAAAKAKREVTELERTPGTEPSELAAARDREVRARAEEEATKAKAEEAHRKLVDDARTRLADAKKAIAGHATGSHSENPALQKAKAQAETALLRLEADALRMDANGKARELQRHCVDHPEMNDAATINRRFQLEGEARTAREAQLNKELSHAEAQHAQGVKGADKRAEALKERLKALEAEGKAEPTRKRSREDEAAARKSITDAEQVEIQRRRELEEAERKLAEYVNDPANADHATDVAKRKEVFAREEAVAKAREAHEDAARNHRRAQLTDELATATGSRKNELERALNKLETEAREVGANRAEAALERFNRYSEFELADPATKSTRREELRDQRRALEDQAGTARQDHLRGEIDLVRQELAELPPTLENHSRSEALRAKLEKLEARQAEHNHRLAEREVKRHQTDMLERELGEPGNRERKPKPMKEADWQERHARMTSELEAREAMLQRELAAAQEKHKADPTHPEVRRLAAELSEVQAAKENMGTPDKPGKYFEAEKAKHAYEVAKAPVQNAQNLLNELFARHGVDPAKWTPDAARQIAAANKLYERALARSGLNEQKRHVEALEKQLAWETERDKRIRRDLGLGDKDPIPDLSRRGWGEDRRRPAGRTTESMLEEARGRLRDAESGRWSKWGKRALGAGLGLIFLKQALDQADQLKGLWDGLEYIENDNGYMYGRSTNGGPIDEMMYSRMTTADPAQYLDIAKALLKDTYGGLLSDEDIEKFAMRIVASGNGGLPSQLMMKDILTEADSLASDAQNIQRILTQRINPPAPTAPVHGVNGFHDLEALRAKGLHLPPRN